MRYENVTVDPKDVGRALKSDYVLTGILQEADNRLRVSVQLVRAEDGTAMWGNHYDVARSDLLVSRINSHAPWPMRSRSR